MSSRVQAPPCPSPSGVDMVAGRPTVMTRQSHTRQTRQTSETVRQTLLSLSLRVGWVGIIGEGRLTSGMGWTRAHRLYRRLLRGVDRLPEQQQVGKARANVREAFILTTALYASPSSSQSPPSCATKAAAVEEALSAGEALAKVLEIQGRDGEYEVVKAIQETHPKWFADR